MKKFAQLLVVLFCAFSFSANAQDTKRFIPPPYNPAMDSISNTFEHLSLNGVLSKTKSERSIIARGDSVRVKVVFMPAEVVKIEAENGAVTTRDDIKKGVWVVTMKPEKSKWCSIKIYSETGSISEVGCVVLVVDPDKYDEIITRSNKLNGQELSRFMDSISGKNYTDLMPPASELGKRWK